MDKMRIDSFDAGYYIGSTLQLKSNAPGQIGIWSLPSTTSPSVLKKTINKGDYVGTIYSYKLDGNNELWWILEGGGYVKHREGYFDLNVANSTSSGKQIADTMQAIKDSDLTEKITKAGSDLISGASSVISDLGGNLKFYLIAVVVIILFLKFSK